MPFSVTGFRSHSGSSDSNNKPRKRLTADMRSAICDLQGKAEAKMKSKEQRGSSACSWYSSSVKRTSTGNGQISR
jgi:hypothetical protein